MPTMGSHNLAAAQVITFLSDIYSVHNTHHNNWVVCARNRGVLLLYHNYVFVVTILWALINFVEPSRYIMQSRAGCWIFCRVNKQQNSVFGCQVYKLHNVQIEILQNIWNVTTNSHGRTCGQNVSEYLCNVPLCYIQKYACYNVENTIMKRIDAIII